MNEINEIKLPKGVDRISVKQHDNKIVIEFIPEKRKFKRGDKVRIKDGISSETHRHIFPHFTELMDEFIGKELTVKEYNDGGWVVFYEDNREYNFAEDWLEPWSEEPKNCDEPKNGDELKKGDLAIFWDDAKDGAIIRLYDEKGHIYHYDSHGMYWKNAIKFESKEQFEKVLRGEIN